MEVIIGEQISLWLHSNYSLLNNKEESAIVESPITIDCGEALTIANVASLHAQFVAALEKTSSIEVNAAKVEKVDTAGLQLLVAVNHELHKSDNSLIWKSASDVLTESISTCGLSSEITITI